MQQERQDTPPSGDRSTTPLTLDGERTLPGVEEENYWFRRHEVAYLACRAFTTGAVVVDAGCGEGYGAALLRRTADRVVAVDYAPAVVAHAATRYPQLDVVRADLQRLPFADVSAEVVVSLQTIEHLHDQRGFVEECARVLRPAGTLVVTTPNRFTFSRGRATPLNPFHTRELSPDELDELLAPAFLVTRRWGVAHGRRLRRWEARRGPLVDALIATAPYAWSPRLRRLVRSVSADDFVVGPDAVDASLDLFYVAVRRP